MKKFPFLEIAIVIALGILIYILIYPSYIKTKNMNNKYDIISNIYGVKAAYEKYATMDNGGVLIDKMNPQIIEYLKDFKLVNPFDDKNYTENDIQFFYIDNTLELNDNTLSGKYGNQRGKPGTFAIGLFIPDRSTYMDIMAKEKLTKDDKKAIKTLKIDITKYGIIGFDKDSIPVIIEDQTSKKLEVFFLLGKKSAID